LPEKRKISPATLQLTLSLTELTVQVCNVVFSQNTKIMGLPGGDKIDDGDKRFDKTKLFGTTHTWYWHVKNKLCGRPPQYATRPVQVVTLGGGI